MARRRRVDRGRVCRHCGSRYGNKPRQLCYACYMDPQVRWMHGLIPCKSNRHGTAHEYNGPSRRGEPTPHRPFSEGCIAAMQARVERGEAVKQPGDATLDGWAPTPEEALDVIGR